MSESATDPPQPLTRKQQWYRQNAEKARADSREWHDKQRQFVSSDTLEELRNDILRALEYAHDGRKWIVCLECGQILQTLSRHLGPEHDMTADAYKEKWGYNRGTSLRTAAQSAAASATRKKKGHQPPAWTHTLLPKAVAAAKAVRHKGYLRRQARLRRSKTRGSYLSRQKVPDTAVHESWETNLPLAEAAKRLGMSKAGLYGRARRLGLDPRATRKKWKVIVAALAALRKHLRSENSHLSPENAIWWIADQIRLGDEKFRAFGPFLPRFERLVTARPEIIREIKKDRGVVPLSQVAAEILRTSAVTVAAPKKENRGRHREDDKDRTYFKIGALVEKEIPIELKKDRHSIVAARRLVSESTHLQFDVVAEYHRRYRQQVAKAQ
jgi:ROS/MUCR transcriptional regulator protein